MSDFCFDYSSEDKHSGPQYAILRCRDCARNFTERLWCWADSMPSCPHCRNRVRPKNPSVLEVGAISWPLSEPSLLLQVLEPAA
jgi:hypothetical protein